MSKPGGTLPQPQGPANTGVEFRPKDTGNLPSDPLLGGTGILPSTPVSGGGSGASYLAPNLKPSASPQSRGDVLSAVVGTQGPAGGAGASNISNSTISTINNILGKAKVLNDYVGATHKTVLHGVKNLHLAPKGYIPIIGLTQPLPPYAWVVWQHKTLLIDLNPLAQMLCDELTRSINDNLTNHYKKVFALLKDLVELSVNKAPLGPAPYEEFNAFYSILANIN